MSLPEPPLSCQSIARSNGPLIPPLFRAIGSCPSLSPLPKETSLGVQSDPLVFQLDVQPRVKGIALNPSESTESCLPNGGRMRLWIMELSVKISALQKLTQNPRLAGFLPGRPTWNLKFKVLSENVERFEPFSSWKSIIISLEDSKTQEPNHMFFFILDNERTFWTSDLGQAIDVKDRCEASSRARAGRRKAKCRNKAKYLCLSASLSLCQSVYLTGKNGLFFSLLDKYLHRSCN